MDIQIYFKYPFPCMNISDVVLLKNILHLKSVAFNELIPWKITHKMYEAALSYKWKYDQDQQTV